MLTCRSGVDPSAPDRKFDAGWSVEVRSECSATGLTGHAVGVPAISGAGIVVTTLNKVLAIAGVALLLGGVALGFRSVSAGGIDCGSTFQPAAGLTPMACDSRLNSASTLVTIVISAGVLALIAAATVKVVRDKASA
ncbi:hypothetical protein EV646_117131 [Kribbella antiqua]|uniref:Uncharacterized protein n=1 Tax=Kribbella antiqua TaxID=2512217 RepID=A0A4V2S2I5_9ACTN|nr:hypothetical protein EV646_117131 [Kribbella antiqua]